MKLASTDDSRRVDWLESIRGLASLQVFALHSFSAFAPGLVISTTVTGTPAGYVRESPLFVLYDGTSAVFVFFVLSGLVLTPAFERRIDRPAVLLAGRIIRLMVPAAAACLFAFALRLALGDPNAAAGQLTGSTFLAAPLQPPLTIQAMLQDALVNAPFLGYDSSADTAIGTLHLLGIDIASRAFDPPMWTLSIELHGSLLLLGLVLARRYSRLTWRLAMGVAMLLLWRTHFLCFLIGHLLALAMRSNRLPRLGWAATAVLVAAGVFLCVREEVATSLIFAAACQTPMWFSLGCTYHPQKLVGAVLIFVALIGSAPIRRALGRPLLVMLGRLSFPIYLVHWPIIFGVGSLVLLWMTPLTGLAVARWVAMGVGALATLAAALLFTPVDAGGIRLGRWVRDWRKGKKAHLCRV